MIMLQDVMRLDNSARMNSPGIAKGNWAWRLPGGFTWQKLSKEAAELRSMAVQFDRCPAVEKAPRVSSTVDDPLEAYCNTQPDADECRIFED
jgi:4-alpha-glucanotransferase